MSKRKIIIGIIVLVVFAGISITLILKNRGPKPIEVETIKTARQQVVETVEATGRIQPKTQVKISADVAAKITDLYVNEGDNVKKGDILVQLDREKFQATVENAEANLRSIQATARVNKENMLKAQKDYKRIKELFQKNLESQAVLDQNYAAAKASEAQYQAALEQVNQARASLKQAEDALSKTSIYAPMAGTVSKLNKEIGEIALGSQFQEDVIMIISNMSGMEALVNVDENDIVSVSVGDSARIEIDALPEKIYEGIVTEIASSATITGEGSTSQKTEFEVKINVLNPDLSIKPGMTASCNIITAVMDSVLAVPIQCVAMKTPDQLKAAPVKKNSSEIIANSNIPESYTTDKDGFAKVVFVVDNNRTIAREVQTGIQSDTDIQIISGIDEGNEIVEGSFRAISQLLKNNTQVQITNKEKDKG